MGRCGSHVWSCNGTVPAGGLGVLSLFASFARTSRSRRIGERRKATTGTSLKIFLSVRWIADWVVSCGVCHGCYVELDYR